MTETRIPMQWETPPNIDSSERVYYDYNMVLDRLKEYPGEWGLVAARPKPRDRVSYIQRRLKALGCEAVVRTVPGDSLIRLYARWPVERGDES